MKYTYLISYLGIKSKFHHIPCEAMIEVDNELNSQEKIHKLRKYLANTNKFKNVLFQNIILIRIDVVDDLPQETEE